MLLHLLHETRYDYPSPVKDAQHLAHLRPRDDGWQSLLRHDLRVAPTVVHRHDAQDGFGNGVSYFSLTAAHRQLRVVADSLVRTQTPATAQTDQPWEGVRERFRYHSGSAYDAAVEFVFASPYVPRHDDFVRYARPHFGANRGLLEASAALMTRIHEDFAYRTDSTEVHTAALEALHLRQGVCQDFAHVMVACLRAMGLSARYVSGYLLTQPPPGQARLIGADASHAWASVYLPGSGWCDFDPTNNRPPGEDYVCLAVGRDYGDVSPMRGVIHGSAQHRLNVAVTVTPLADDADEALVANTQTQSQTQGESAGAEWRPFHIQGEAE